MMTASSSRCSLRLPTRSSLRAFYGILTEMFRENLNNVHHHAPPPPTQGDAFSRDGETRASVFFAELNASRSIRERAARLTCFAPLEQAEYDVLRLTNTLLHRVPSEAAARSVADGETKEGTRTKSESAAARFPLHDLLSTGGIQKFVPAFFYFFYFSTTNFCRATVFNESPE